MLLGLCKIIMCCTAGLVAQMSCHTPKDCGDILSQRLPFEEVHFLLPHIPTLLPYSLQQTIPLSFGMRRVFACKHYERDNTVCCGKEANLLRLAKICSKKNSPAQDLAFIRTNVFLSSQNAIFGRNYVDFSYLVQVRILIFQIAMKSSKWKCHCSLCLSQQKNIIYICQRFFFLLKVKIFYLTVFQLEALWNFPFCGSIIYFQTVIGTCFYNIMIVKQINLSSFCSELKFYISFINRLE